MHADEGVRATPFHLASDVGGEEVQQYSKQRQSRNAVGSQDPCATAFVMGMVWMRLWSRYDSTAAGLMFHANLLGYGNIAALLGRSVTFTASGPNDLRTAGMLLQLQSC